MAGAMAGAMALRVLALAAVLLGICGGAAGTCTNNKPFDELKYEYRTASLALPKPNWFSSGAFPYLIDLVSGAGNGADGSTDMVVAYYRSSSNGGPSIAVYEVGQDGSWDSSTKRTDLFELANGDSIFSKYGGRPSIEFASCGGALPDIFTGSFKTLKQFRYNETAQAYRELTSSNLPPLPERTLEMVYLVVDEDPYLRAGARDAFMCYTVGGIPGTRCDYYHMDANCNFVNQETSLSFPNDFSSVDPHSPWTKGLLVTSGLSNDRTFFYEPEYDEGSVGCEYAQDDPSNPFRNFKLSSGAPPIGSSTTFGNYKSIAASGAQQNTHPSLLCVGSNYGEVYCSESTQIDSQTPTVAPTASPVPFGKCQSSILISVDQSWSVNRKMLNRQKAALKSFIDSVDIGPGSQETQIALTRFGDDYRDLISVQNMNAASNDPQLVRDLIDEYIESSRNKIAFTNFIPLFQESHYGQELSLSHENPTILILSDGKPYTREFRGGRRALREACDAVNRFRQLTAWNPVSILCFQSDNKSKSKAFFKCACDAVWKASDKKSRNIPDEVIALQMKNFVCKPPPELRPKDPCDELNNMNFGSTKEKKRACARVVRNYRGLKADDVGFQAVTYPQCEFKQNKCSLKDKYEHLYN